MHKQREGTICGIAKERSLPGDVNGVQSRTQDVHLNEYIIDFMKSYYMTNKIMHSFDCFYW